MHKGDIDNMPIYIELTDQLSTNYMHNKTVMVIILSNLTKMYVLYVIANYLISIQLEQLIV